MLAIIGRFAAAAAARRLVGHVARRHGGAAGMALGAALASKRYRRAGLAGAAALTALELLSRSRRPAQAEPARR
jgi:hypothetical protein